MRIMHRVPNSPPTANMSGKIDPDYERDIERQTAQRESQYAAAMRALEAAEKRAAAAERREALAKTPKVRRLSAKQTAAAWAAVELRREDLAIVHRMMTSTAAGSVNRGTKSYRPVPARHGNVLP